jgi:hypothetical protein
LTPEGSPTICHLRIKDQYSPIDFGSGAVDEKRSCEWAKRLYLIASAIDTSNYSPIDTAKIPELRTRDYAWFRDVLMGSVRDYDRQIRAKKDLQAQLEDETPVIATFFAPLLLILGVAPRITKVSGELRHEIQARRSNPGSPTPH